MITRPKTPNLKVEVFDAFLRHLILESPGSKVDSFLQGLQELGLHFTDPTSEDIGDAPLKPVTAAPMGRIHSGYYLMSLFTNYFNAKPLRIKPVLHRVALIKSSGLKKGDHMLYKHVRPYASWSEGWLPKGVLDNLQDIWERSQSKGELGLAEVELTTTDYRGKVIWTSQTSLVMEDAHRYVVFLKKSAEESGSRPSKELVPVLDRVRRDLELAYMQSSEYADEKEVILYQPKGVRATVVKVFK